MSANLSNYRLPERFRADGIAPAQKDTRALLLFATLLTLVLSFVPYSEVFLYPLRLFVTFVHESGHALASLLVGGSVSSVSVAPNGSGLTYSTGYTALTAWLVCSAGYLGTTLFGAALLQLGRARGLQNPGRVMLYALAGAMLAIMIWVRDPFTLVTGLGIAGLFWFAARKASPRVAEFLAMFLAVQCSLNALVDLRTLLYLSTKMPEAHTDALNMQHMYLLPAAFWAFMWALTAVVVLGVSLWSYFRAMAKSRL